MYKLLLTIFSILFLGSTSTLGQPYQSIFGKNSTKWVYRWGDEFGWHNDTIFAIKDTIIKGNTYKLLATSSYYHNPIFLLREDTITGTVWCRTVTWQGTKEDTTDRIISIMDLKIGDTFDVTNIRLEAHNNNPSNNIVDSVNYVNGLKHIYMRGQYYGEPYTLIEGVGSNMGIQWKYRIMPENTFTGGFYLLCSYKDGVKTNYQNRIYNGSCWFASSIEYMSDTKPSFYPNPVTNILTIQQADDIIHLSVTDISGKQVFKDEQPVFTNDNYRINTSNLLHGVYFLQTVNTQGYITTRKFIKAAQ